MAGRAGTMAATHDVEDSRMNSTQAFYSVVADRFIARVVARALHLAASLAMLGAVAACSGSNHDPVGEHAASVRDGAASGAPASMREGSAGKQAVSPAANVAGAAGSAPDKPREAVSAAAAGMGASAGGAASPPSYCSGCPKEKLDPKDMTVHLHHVHLNVGSRAASMGFYEKHLAAKRITLNDVSDALLASPTLLLLDEQSKPPVSKLPTALQHVGWGSKDVGAWYASAHAQGVAPDTRGGTLFNTDETPTIGEPGSGKENSRALGLEGGACGLPAQDAFSYMYILGPDMERIEVWSGVDQRVNHVHFTSATLAATARWYQQFLGVTGTATADFAAFMLDDILFFFEPVGRSTDYEPTDDHVLGHIAFSVTDLEAWRTRALDLKIEIVAQPTEVHGFKSFFVRGPDRVLIELVQAAKNADLCAGSRDTKP